MSKLYLMVGLGEQDFDCDLFVYADTPHQALQLWKEYCAQNEWPYLENKVLVYTVPEIEKVGAIDWSDIESRRFAT